jgi:hypothetical protein
MDIEIAHVAKIYHILYIISSKKILWKNKGKYYKKQRCFNVVEII